MGRFAVPLLIGILGAAVLVALGIWQVQRLEWKTSVLDEIEARIGAEPVAVPEDADPTRDRYLPVRATGSFGEEEVHILVSTREIGPAFRVISPFTTEQGRRILVDRGIVPDEAKEDRRPAGAATIRGNLHWPDEVNAFTPDRDVARNVWFARDVGALADALGTEPVLVILRETSQAEPGVTPLPVDTSGIPNDHLEYAVTWFGLAAVWVLMTGLWVRRIARGSA